MGANVQGGYAKVVLTNASDPRNKVIPTLTTSFTTTAATTGNMEVLPVDIAAPSDYEVITLQLIGTDEIIKSFTKPRRVVRARSNDEVFFALDGSTYTPGSTAIPDKSIYLFPYETFQVSRFETPFTASITARRLTPGNSTLQVYGI